MPAKTSTLFDVAPFSPPDSIFGLIEEYKQDPRANKVNLSIGVYQDEEGQIPLMQAVRTAEQEIVLQGQHNKNYLPIGGSPRYCDLVGRLVLGDLAEEFHWSTAQTPGGTVALRVAGETLRRVFNVSRIWMSNPTWANHPQIFEAAGLAIGYYDYLQADKTALNFSGLLDSLQKTSPGDGILLHTVCHNPTGVDLSEEQWSELTELILQRQLYPVFDFAYQGFGESLRKDSFPIEALIRSGGEALICNSFSKNFGLYGERVGGVTAVAQSQESSRCVQSQVQATIRAIYSNPPLHGGLIVEKVLGNAELRDLWQSELEEIRARIASLRKQFVQTLKTMVPHRNFEYINQQRGMFSYSGLTGEQAERLKADHGVYILRSGRINIAGINQHNLQSICQAISRVV
jgi:aspartate/tyrosine/aromatic aminotransferase